MLQSYHQNAEHFEILFNKGRFEALPARMKAIISNGVEAASSEILAKIKGLPKERLKGLLKKAETLATQTFLGLQQQAQQSMERDLDAEINRLEALKHINPSVRPEEIQALMRQKQELSAAFSKAQLHLDSFRLII